MPPSRILIHRLGSLGDTVMALPALHAVRQAYPSAEITLLTNQPVSSRAPRIQDVLSQGYFYNQLVAYPRATRNPLWIARVAWQIRKTRPDLVINLTEYKSDHAIARYKRLFRSCSAKCLVGFEMTSADRHQTPDPLTGLVDSEAVRLLRRVRTLGTIDLNSRAAWDLRLNESELGQGSELVGNECGDRLIAFSIGTKMQSKDWGVDNWCTTVSELAQKLPGWRAVFVGAQEEHETTEICASRWRGERKNLCGRATPRVTAAALKKCRVFVGHDSGPMHLAAASGVPCVAVFSARVYPGKWFPWGQNHRCLYHLTDCANCKLEVCIQQGKRCLKAISAADVVNATLETIAREAS